MAIALAPSFVERFWSGVDKDGPELREGLGPCWTWTASRFSNGRGQFWIGTKRCGRVFLAHRVAWLLEYGEWPKDCALHHCDGGEIGCVRPSHLFNGTRLDNMRDMVAKGRQARGERLSVTLRGELCGTAKLTEDSVRAIRALYSQGELSQREIGERFGVGHRAIGRIVNFERWAHVGSGT
jgi:hypothetical protein